MSNVLRVLLIVFIAAIGAVVFKVLYSNATKPAQAAQIVTDRVRVAAADLPQGLLLRETDLSWKAVPHDSVPSGALIDTPASGTDFKGSVLRHEVTANAIIVSSDTLSPSSPGFLAAALKPGMRAVSVGIDDVSGNAGLIQPGDFVDLLLTQQIDSVGGNTAGHTYSSETVVSRVRVLAVGSEYQRPKSDSEANEHARTVTLEVLPQTAQVVSVASRLGSLSLALRSFAVSDRSQIEGSSAVVEPTLPPVYSNQVSRALAAPAPAPAIAARSIMIYRGSGSAPSTENGSGGGSAIPSTGGAVLPPPLPSQGAAAPANQSAGVQ